MKLLAIDTSTEQASVALHDNNTITQRIHPSQRQHAHFLLPIIDELLSDFELSLKQLDGIVFGCGPGSFTGLRIACSIAKGLSYAHDLPLMPASTLTTIAEDACQQYAATSVLAVIDARMNQVYWQYYTKDKPGDEYVTFAKEVILPTETPVLLAGVGFESYIDELPPVMDSHKVYPSAAAMIRLALKSKLKSITAEEALPVYIRDQVV